MVESIHTPSAPACDTEGWEPVSYIPGDRNRKVQEGIALCLSGGGYRAMLFHAGMLWRLNEAGLLRALDRVSSVSGGSITAGVLAMNWGRLDFKNGIAREFEAQVVKPLRSLAGITIDVTAILSGLTLPFVSISDQVADDYARHVFDWVSLQDLPDHPRFVFNATNLESGVLMRFSKPYLADYRVGRVDAPRLPLATVIAASSAFPPLLSPCTIDLSKADWKTDQGNDLTGARYRGEIRLSDGGVYDNLGLETAWKLYSRILVSDAGARFKPEPDPAIDWPRQALRVIQIMDSQVRALRKRQVIATFKAGKRKGMYVGIRSDPRDYPAAPGIPFDPAIIDRLAKIPTRLDAMNSALQEELINWGYAICDTGLRSHVTPDAAPGSLPYPSHPLAGTA